MNAIEMMNVLRNFIIFVVDGLITLLLYCFLVGRFDYVRKNKIKSIAFIALYGLVRWQVQPKVVIGVGPVIAIFFVAFFLSFAMKVPILSSVLANIVIIITFIFFDGFYYFVQYCIDLLDYSETVQSLLLFADAMVVSALHLLFIWILYRKGRALLQSSLFKQSYKYLFISFSNVLLMLFFYLFASLDLLYPYTNNIYEGLMFFIIPIALVLSVLDYRQREINLQNEYEYKKQRDYVANMEGLLDILREHRHESNNQLLTLYGLANQLDSKKVTSEEIKTYIEELMQTSGNVENAYRTGNIYIDGLLSVKGEIAAVAGIHMELSVKGSMHELVLAKDQYISLLGNLIDNSIEALCESSQSLKIIGISLENSKHIFKLSVSNNGPQIEHVDRIFDKDFSTKEKDKSFHGYGLYLVQRIVDEVDGSIQVESSQERTRFTVVIKDSILKNMEEEYKYDKNSHC